MERETKDERMGRGGGELRQIHIPHGECQGASNASRRRVRPLKQCRTLLESLKRTSSKEFHWLGFS